MCAIFCEKFEDTDFLQSGSIFHFEIHNIQVGGIFAVGCGSVMSSFRNVRVFTSDI